MEKEKEIVAPAYLSVCIPTWNRAAFLKENIKQLLNEIEKVPHLSIEIIISDNASTDDTQAYCESLIQQYSFISYHRNTENKGPNANFQQVIELANGVYVWLLGDDDRIVEDCFEKIIVDSKKFNGPDIMIGGSINDETRERLYPPFIQSHLLTDKMIFKEFDGVRLAGKISVLIFKKQSIIPVLKLSRSIIQTLKTPWPHIIWLIILLSKNKKVLFLPYGTNYFIEKNRCNMLQDGISRVNVVVREYATLIYRLNSLRLLTPDFYKILERSITHHRQFELLKVMGYSTYFNAYFPALSNAFSNWLNLRGLRNRFNFFVFYVFPLMFPIFLRKAFLNSIQFCFSGWFEYKRYLSYLKSAKKLFTENNKRNIFLKEDL